jgi:hypothetical protein
MKMGIAKNMKMLLNCFSSYEQKQNNKLPLNSDGQQIYQYQQKNKLPLNNDGQQIYQYQQKINYL